MNDTSSPDDRKIFMKVIGVKISDVQDWAPPPKTKPSRTYQETVGAEKAESVAYIAPKPCMSSEALVGQRTDKGYLVSLNDELIALFKVQGKLYALRDSCPHAGGPLSMGDIEDLPGEGLCVRCPWHQWKILLKSGAVGEKKGRKQTGIVYPVKVNSEGDIYIGFDQVSNRFFNLDKYPSVDIVPKRTW